MNENSIYSILKAMQSTINLGSPMYIPKRR